MEKLMDSFKEFLRSNKTLKKRTEHPTTSRQNDAAKNRATLPEKIPDHFQRPQRIRFDDTPVQGQRLSIDTAHTKSYTEVSQDMRNIANLAYGEQDHSSIKRIELIQKASSQVGYAFKDGKKYGGTVKESWKTAINSYEQIVLKTYMLSDNEALYLLPHMLKDNALTFFDQNVKAVATDYTVSKQMMASKFHNTAQQQRVLSFLKNLHLRDYLDGNRTINEAYCALTDEIESKFHSIPHGLQMDEYKRDLLIASMENMEWCAIELYRPNSVYPTYHDLYIALADCAQRYCQKQMKLGNDRGPYGGIQKPIASVNYTNARYGRPNGSSNFRRGPQNRNTLNRSNFRRSSGKCFYCQKPGHMKRNCPFRKRGKRIYDTLFAAVNDTNPTGEGDGTNHDSVMSILQAALAQEDTANDDDTLELNDQLAATLLCEIDNAHDQFASHEGYDEEDNDIAQEGHIHHTGFLAEFADDYANDVVNNDDVPHF
ncbi:hypothetical protein FGB62_113g06 [Gracilaria domingensis]|nr:hypothetical protein FGB62_113g06 [Gracilaria domingensis]